MTFLKLKILVAFILICSIDQICCETNTLEGKYETGKEILLSITINHDNITSLFAKIDGEYNYLSDVFKDQNDKSIDDFNKLSKNQTVMEVNYLAQNLNKLSLDEQLKYEDFIQKNIPILEEVMPLFDSCLENYNGLKNKLRCIDQNQNPKNETQKECYENVIDLLNSYNSVLISKIKNIEKNFMATTNEVISIAKNNNDELIRRKSRISLPPTAPKKKDNSIVKYLFSKTNVNNTLKNLYINQKNMLNIANLSNWLVIQSINSNITLNYISRVNNITGIDRKNVQCCFNHSKVELNNATNIAVIDSDECIEIEKLNLEILVALENNEAKKHFPTCFYNDPRPENIFMCMGSHQSSRNATKILKSTYTEAVNKFNNHQQFLSDKISSCSYKSRVYFDASLINLNNQFEDCIKDQKRC